jgi:hypothetical protein
MKKFFMGALAITVASTLGACQGQRGQETKKVDTKTHSETTQGGETVEKETDTASRVPGDNKLGKTDSEHNEYVGVVTKFNAGKSLTIKGADGETHSFDLNDRNSSTTVAPSIKNGSKVQVTVDKTEGQPQTVKISPHS